MDFDFDNVGGCLMIALIAVVVMVLVVCVVVVGLIAWQTLGS